MQCVCVCVCMCVCECLFDMFLVVWFFCNTYRFFKIFEKKIHKGLMALSALITNMDICYPFDNISLYSLQHLYGNKNKGKVYHLNYMVSNIMSTLTAGMRFQSMDSSVLSHLRSQDATMVARPRLKFIASGFSPTPQFTPTFQVWILVFFFFNIFFIFLFF